MSEMQQPVLQDVPQDRGRRPEWERGSIVGACIIAAYIVTLIGGANAFASWDQALAELAVVFVTFFVTMTALRLLDMIALRRRVSREFTRSTAESSEFWSTIEKKDPDVLKRAENVDEEALLRKAQSLRRNSIP